MALFASASMKNQEQACVMNLPYSYGDVLTYIIFQGLNVMDYYTLQLPLIAYCFFWAQMSESLWLKLIQYTECHLKQFDLVHERISKQRVKFTQLTRLFGNPTHEMRIYIQITFLPLWRKYPALNTMHWEIWGLNWNPIIPQYSSKQIARGFKQRLSYQTAMRILWT